MSSRSLEEPVASNVVPQAINTGIIPLKIFQPPSPLPFPLPIYHLIYLNLSRFISIFIHLSVALPSYHTLSTILKAITGRVVVIRRKNILSSIVFGVNDSPKLIQATEYNLHIFSLCFPRIVWRNHKPPFPTNYVT